MRFIVLDRHRHRRRRVAVYVNGALVWPRTDWKPRALCHGIDAATFIPDYHRGNPVAPSGCAQPVPGLPGRGAECLAYAKATRSVGWWGGVFVRYPHSERVHDRPRQAKLTEIEVTAIRDRYARGGVTQRQLAGRARCHQGPDQPDRRRQGLEGRSRPDQATPDEGEGAPHRRRRPCDPPGQGRRHRDGGPDGPLRRGSRSTIGLIMRRQTWADLSD